MKIDEPTKIEIREALKWVSGQVLSMQDIFRVRERGKLLFTSLICRIKHTCLEYTKNISRKYFRSTNIYRCFEIVQQMFLFRLEFSFNFVFLIWFSFGWNVWIKYRNLQTHTHNQHKTHTERRFFRWRVVAGGYSIFRKNAYSLNIIEQREKKTY